MQQPDVPILVGGGGEQTTLRFAAHYVDASNLGPVSRAAGAFESTSAVRKLAVLDGHLATGIRYVIFIVMPVDEETLRVLAEQVLPAVT